MNHLLFFILIFSSGECLNKFLKHYESLNYQAVDLSRVSRSADKTIRLNFHAYDRDFKLILAPIKNANEKRKGGSNMYEGTVKNEENSHVLGSIRDGIFEGMIQTSNGEEFWVESSIPYNSNASFHSFIYSTTEMQMPQPPDRTKRSPLHPYFPRHSPTTHPKVNYQSIPYNLCYSELHNSLEAESLLHKKRATKRPILMDHIDINEDVEENESVDDNEESNRLCTVLVEVDHFLYDWVREKYKTSSIQQTRQKVKDLIDPLFHYVNYIYKSINFGGIKGIHFKAAGYRIWHDKEQRGYPFKEDTRNGDRFLEMMGMKRNHDLYCLAFVFTYRDFDKAVQGLAFACHMCTTHITSSDNITRNIGMVTFNSRGHLIPQGQWHLTLAHEFAHSLGSGHDEKLMSSGKSEGEEYPECKHNRNRLFKLKTNREPGDLQTNCLIHDGDPICGNGIVEPNEACDCGISIQECTEAGDNCCWPADAVGKGCTLKDPFNNKCSPSQGTCCNDQCQFVERGQTCLTENDCLSDAKCSGRHSVCPEQKPINEGKLCEDVSGICNNGLCNVSICAAEGMKQCQSSKRTCIVHCQGKDGVCRSTASLSQFTSSTNYSQNGRWGHPGVMMSPNDICLDGLGYCSNEDLCKDAVYDRAESQSRVHHGITTFGEFLMEKWWILILISVVAILILLLTILLCFYKMPKLSLRSDTKECCNSKTAKTYVVVADPKVDAKVEVKTNATAVTKSEPPLSESKTKPIMRPGVSSVTGNWKNASSVMKKNSN